MTENASQTIENRDISAINTILTVEAEMEVWEYKLNIVVGVGGALAAISCLGTPHPSLYSAIVALAVLPLGMNLDPFFPKTIRLLREKARKNQASAEEKKLLDNISRHFFTPARMLRKNWTYFIGTALFAYVILSEGIYKIIPWLINK